ncbi:MAG: TetR/AcrR family transcriptional regulator [Novosphingobium sp.]
MAGNSPRKRDAEATRARILAAAQRAFSETGYSHTGIRDIARIAGTSSTLLLRYFGSKAGLFEAALIAAMPASATLDWGKDSYATSLADALLTPESEVRPPVMIALAAGDPEAAMIAARVTERHAIAPLAEWLGGERANERAVAVAALATGFVTYLRQLPLTNLSDEERLRLRAWFVASVDALIAG